MKAHLRSLGLMLSVVLSVAACAAAPGNLANRSMTQALSFTPPPGKSSIYVIRPGGFVGLIALWDVDLDADSLGKLGAGSFLFAVVPPGEHNLRVVYQRDGLTFTTEPDQNYFFVVKPGFTGSVSPISEGEGREYVAKYK
jgi:hypothetical protein